MKAKMTKAMYGKSMMGKGGMKQYQDGGYNDTSGKKKLGPALGIGIPSAAGVGIIASMIKNAVKRKKDKKAEENKKLLEENAKTKSSTKFEPPAPTSFEKQKRGGAMRKTKFMTGGMTNANAKVSALKKAGSNGVKSGVNPKASASKVAKGRSGGISKAPKGATPTKNKKK